MGSTDRSIKGRLIAGGKLLYATHLRYTRSRGNLFAAGITYFSVLSVIPLAMLAFAGIGFFLSARHDLLPAIHTYLADFNTPQLTDPLVDALATAIDRKNSIGLLGLIIATWTGLGWIGNLRDGVTAMWATEEELAEETQPASNGLLAFLCGKGKDLLGLLILLIALLIAMGVTIAGAWLSTSTTGPLLGFGSGILANYVVLVWLLAFLPRIDIPRRQTARVALPAALCLELIKQCATLAVGVAGRNPAVAVFGPVIALMVVFYLLWRLVLFFSALAAQLAD